jgi:Na+/H+ antiporter NhaC
VFEDIPVMFHVIILLAVVSAFAGMWFGLNSRRRNVDDEVKYPLAWVGVIVACIVALIIAFAPLSAIGLEVAGLVFCLSLLLGFLGIGLSIGPDRRE